MSETESVDRFEFQNDFQYLIENTDIELNPERYKYEEILAILKVLDRNTELENKDEERKDKLHKIKTTVFTIYNSQSNEECKFCCSTFILWLNPSYLCYRCCKNVCRICVNIIEWDERSRIICPNCCIDLLIDLRSGKWFDLETKTSRRLIHDLESSQKYEANMKYWEKEKMSLQRKRRSQKQREIKQPEKKRDCPEVLLKKCFKESVEQRGEIEMWTGVETIIKKWKYMTHQNSLTSKLKEEEDKKQELLAKEQTEKVKKEEKKVDDNKEFKAVVRASIKYDFKESKMLIYIHSCEDLPEMSNEKPSSYVEIKIQPSTNKHHSFRTKTIPKNSNPQFMESFSINISESRLEQCNLLITVNSTTDGIIGEIILSLKEYIIHQTTNCEMYYLNKPMIVEESKSKMNTIQKGFKSSSEEELDNIPLMNNFNKYTSIFFYINFERTEFENTVAMTIDIKKLLDIDLLPLKNEIKLTFNIKTSVEDHFDGRRTECLKIMLNKEKQTQIEINKKIYFSCNFMWSLSTTLLLITIGNSLADFAEASYNIQDYIAKVGEKNDWIPHNLQFSTVF